MSRCRDEQQAVQIRKIAITGARRMGNSSQTLASQARICSKAASKCSNSPAQYNTNLPKSSKFWFVRRSVSLFVTLADQGSHSDRCPGVQVSFPATFRHPRTTKRKTNAFCSCLQAPQRSLIFFFWSSTAARSRKASNKKRCGSAGRSRYYNNSGLLCTSSSLSERARLEWYDFGRSNDSSRYCH